MTEHTPSGRREDIRNDALVQVPAGSHVLRRSGVGSVVVVLELRVDRPVEPNRPGAPRLRAGLRIDVTNDALVLVPVRLNGALDLVPRRRDEVVRLRRAPETVERHGVGDVRAGGVAVDVCEDGLTDVYAALEGVLDLGRVRGEDAVGDAVADGLVKRDGWESADLRRPGLGNNVNDIFFGRPRVTYLEGSQSRDAVGLEEQGSGGESKEDRLHGTVCVGRDGAERCGKVPLIYLLTAGSRTRLSW